MYVAQCQRRKLFVFCLPLAPIEGTRESLASSVSIAMAQHFVRQIHACSVPRRAFAIGLIGMNGRLVSMSVECACFI